MQAGLMANTKPLTFHDGLYGKLVRRRRDVFRKLGFFFCFFFFKARRRENGDSEESTPKSEAPRFFIGHQTRI